MRETARGRWTRLGALLVTTLHLGLAGPARADTDLVAWLTGLWPEAAAKGVSRATFDAATADIKLDPDVLVRLDRQVEHTRGVGDYLALLVTPERIEAGRQKLAEQATTLAAVETATGVDRHILVAVWGIESNYGTAMGTTPIIAALATLGLKGGRRADFGRREFISALLILERGEAKREDLIGSWAGAMGHTQFIPSTYLAHAVDFDRDGRRDIWRNVGDALASTGNYLKVSGWKAGEPVAIEVVLPDGFDFALSAPTAARALGDWQGLGLKRPDGRSWPEAKAPLILRLPAGAGGPAFLAGPNFRAILAYNQSVSYALAVGHLAERIAGGAPIAGRWPADDRPLTREEREDLQRLLTAAGHDTGSVDGVLGVRTRAAIRTYQKASGLPEDGHPSAGLLARLRAAVLP